MKTTKSFLLVGLFALFAIIVTSCGDGGKAAKEKATQDSIRVADSLTAVQRVADSLAALPKTIAETAINTPSLSTLVAALSAGELVEVFKGTHILADTSLADNARFHKATSSMRPFK